MGGWGRGMIETHGMRTGGVRRRLETYPIQGTTDASNRTCGVYTDWRSGLKGEGRGTHNAERTCEKAQEINPRCNSVRWRTGWGLGGGGRCLARSDATRPAMFE